MNFHIRLFCRFDRHEPIRREVRWDGLHYVSTCTSCGQAIRRKDKGEWRRWNPSGLFKTA